MPVTDEACRAEQAEWDAAVAAQNLVEARACLATLSVSEIDDLIATAKETAKVAKEAAPLMDRLFQLTKNETICATFTHALVAGGASATSYAERDARERLAAYLVIRKERS